MKITVLGIGNILLKDEGFGVRVIEELHRRYRFEDSVQVLDGGTLGLDLLQYVTGTNKLLVVDAIAGGQTPGTLYRLDGDEVQAYFAENVSLHELGIRDVLAVLEVVDQPVDEVVVLGVEPKVVELGLELTPTVGDKIQVAVRAVFDQLRDWEASVTER